MAQKCQWEIPLSKPCKTFSDIAYFISIKEINVLAI